jgi:beta-glucosidase
MPYPESVPDFPPEFLWGSATAAHQVEGGNTNSDWWAWEHAAGTLAAEPSGDAIDHYHRYDDDFALLASLGQNAHRISVEWSRIEPAPGEFSAAALAHYRRVLDSLARHGLTSFVTLYHKTLPRWFSERGGWLAPDAVERFENYVEVVAEALGDRIAYACTINEPQIIAVFGHATGQFPPALTDIEAAAQVNKTLMLAHRRAVNALRLGAGKPLVGVCLQLVPMRPARAHDDDDIAAAAWLQHVMTDSHIDELSAGGDVGDFVGLQYYTRATIDSRLPELIAPAPSGVEVTEMGWEVYPAGFGAVLQRTAEVGLPIVVTENGLATTDDHQRVRFLASHLSELKRALDDGVDVRGYLHWSAFDNFEWNHGHRPTFGLIGIDRARDLRRIVRPSAVAYGRLARTGNLCEIAVHEDEQDLAEAAPIRVATGG